MSRPRKGLTNLPDRRCTNCGKPVYYSALYRAWYHRVTFERKCKDAVGMATPESLSTYLRRVA